MNKNNMTKSVTLSQIQEDLASGLTKWKKDDIGFGSLEKKYQLTLDEMVKLTAHPKVALMETRIPTFVIVDDLQENEEPRKVIEVVPLTTEFVREVEAAISVEQPRVEIQEEPKVTATIAVEQKKVQQSAPRPRTLTTFI